MIYATDDEFEGNSREEKAALGKITGTTLFFDLLTPARVQKWLIRHFEAEGVSVSDVDAAYLISRCGTAMTELSSSVSKLCAYVKEKGKTVIERGDIEELIPQKNVFSAFYISDNIRKRDAAAL